MLEIAIAKRLHTCGGAVDVSIEMAVAARRLVTVCGRSGAGKSTLLHMLCGLVAPDAGTIRAGGRSWFDSGKKINLPPSRRGIGMVFQDYALFPNMTVRKNLEFALRAKNDHAIVNEMLHATGLEEFQDRYPALLSGGQRQRVALARALVSRPEILLLDEPLSALDPPMRHSLQKVILEAHERFSLTTILVSHDADEIAALSDRVFVLDNGRVLDAGAPRRAAQSAPAGPAIALRGIVRSLAHGSAGVTLALAFGVTEVRTRAPESQCAEVAIGDEIEITGSMVNPRIRKIDPIESMQNEGDMPWEHSLDTVGRF